MEPIPESEAAVPSTQHRPLDTLSSGLRLALPRGGALQAHICCVGHPADVTNVLEILGRAEAFKAVTNWAYAYRIAERPGHAGQPRLCLEAVEDGCDEGCGEKILAILRRFELHGLLLVVCRWQDYGATPGLELFGTSLYSLVTERAKDLVVRLQQQVVGHGLGGGSSPFGASLPDVSRAGCSSTPKNRSFDFGFLPALKEPKAQPKFTPNHFLAGTSLRASSSLPSLFAGGGDPKQWMENDKNLRALPEAEIWELRALRQPDERIERVLHAVASLRGQKVVRTGTPAARWGHCLQVLKSSTFRTELLLLDAGSVPKEAARTAAQFLVGLDADELRRASPAAAALFEWALSVARWRLEGPPEEAGADPSDFELHALRPREAALAKSWSGPSRMRAAPGRCLRRRIEQRVSPSLLGTTS